jgi:hypothetical protein
MKSEFSELHGFLERSHDRLFLAYSHFQIWEVFQEMRAPNKVKKKQAGKNLKTMNRFNSFFGLTIEAHRRIFALELAKFFDPNKDSLSIVKIINFARINRRKLTVKEFKKFDPERPHLENLAKKYEGIQNKDLEECERLLSDNGLDLKPKKQSLIWKLKKFRDQSLAHDQVKKEKIPISVREIETLFRLTEKILNLFSYKLNHNSVWHFTANDSVKRHTKLVVKHLQEFEKHRRKEIQEDQERELKNIKNV